MLQAGPLPAGALLLDSAGRQPQAIAPLPHPPSVITDCLQGELEVTTAAGSGRAREGEGDLVERLPFLLLGLDLPPAPLFKDAL